MRMQRKFFLLLFILAALLSAGPALLGQTTGISGSSTINKCDTETYTITITNDSAAPICNLVVTNTMPGSSASDAFSYVANSATVCTPSGCADCNLTAGNAEPSITGWVLEWDIDTLCGGTVNLGIGETLTVTFDMETNCDTVSGTNVVDVGYSVTCPDVDAPDFTESDSMSIQVNPGAVTVRMEPAVPNGGLGDTVNWTLRIRNTGLGTIKNVDITNVNGDGLLYSSDDASGVNSGNTTTWTSAEVPQLAEMAPNAEVTIALELIIIACDNLDNVCDVRFGCDSVTTCWDTAVDGGTATASVKFEPKAPYLVLTPPVIDLDYCETDDTVTLSLFNDNATATGSAFDTIVCVDMGPLSVSNVQNGVTFNAGPGSCGSSYFGNIPEIAPGDTYNITFDVSFTDNCNGTSGTLLFIPEYLDECDNSFFPTPVLGSYTLGTASSSLTVDKTGPATAYIGTQQDFDITVTYTGPTTCGSGTTGDITITDTIPADFVVIDPGTGTWTPGGGGTGGTIDWTIAHTAANPFTDTIRLELPDRDNCETYCNQTFNNTVSASVTDCCGCTLTENATTTTAIECDQDTILTSSKGAVPATFGPCETTTITNTYNFADNALLDPVTLNELELTEANNNNMEYVAASLSVTLGGSGVAGVTATQATATDPLVIDFDGAPASAVRNLQLVVSYDMQVTNQSAPQPACATANTFYSWSDLDLGPDQPTGQCLDGSPVHETIPLTVQPPSMTVGIGTLPNFVENCGSYPVTITVNQLGTVEPYDVKLVLENVNYYVINITGEGGVTPTDYANPTAITYGGEDAVQWDYFDAFAVGGATGTITLDVQKRCSDAPELVVHLFYDDLCYDDNAGDQTDYDERCTPSDTDSSLLLLDGDIFIEKTPEVIFAESNQVTWTIYVTNAGDGTATNVTIEDTLQAGHTYDSSAITPSTGTTTTPGSPANGVTWTIDSMDPGEVREIDIVANMIACEPLGNSVTAYWGCDYDGNSTIDEECERVGPIVATVENPTPNLVSTSITLSPLDSCTDQTATITLRNAGQTDVYNMIVSQTLPTGLTYLDTPAPTYRIYDDSAASWGGSSVAPDPNPDTNPLVWDYTDGPGALYDDLAHLEKGDIIEITFNLQSICTFSGGTLDVVTQYDNACGETVSPNSVGSFILDAREPEIEVRKTRTVPVAAIDPVFCGDPVTWQIEVENVGSITAPVVWVLDTLEAGYTFTGSTGDGTYMIDNGFNGYGGDNQITSFEILALPAGATAVMTISANSAAGGGNCNDIANAVDAYWGCDANPAAVDGASNTHPTDDGACLDNTAAQATAQETRIPDFDIAATLNPSTIDACNTTQPFTLEITNNSSVGSIYNLDAVITLPTGLTYELGTTAITCPTTCGVGDPALTVGDTVLTYYDTGNNVNPNNLCDELGAGETLTLVLDLTSDCYVDDNINIALSYNDCCGDRYTPAGTDYPVTADEPALTIAKTPDNVVTACGDDRSWNIEVTNTSTTATADLVIIEDQPGDWIDIDLGASTAGGVLVSSSPDIYQWEVGPIAPGDNTSITVVGTFNPDTQNDCDIALRQNGARARWGCGTPDGNPATSDCLQGTWTDLDYASIATMDLRINSITPDTDCSGATPTGTVVVDVTALGTAVPGDVVVRLASSCAGITFVDQTVNFTAGQTQDVTFNYTPTCTDCSCTFTATLDPGNLLCECDETNNADTSAAFTPTIPDLEPTADTLAVICSADGAISVTGGITIDNNGCNGAFTDDIPVRFTLYDAIGCDGGTGSQVRQWTQTFETIADSINITAGGNQIFTIDPETFTNNICTTAPSGQYSILVEVDHTAAICECDNDNNDWCADNKNNTIPDLVVTDIDISGITCSGDGITGSVDVTVRNDGYGGATEFYVNLETDGCYTFTAQRIEGPLFNGGSETLTFTISGSYADCTDCSCVFTATVDSDSDICECNGANNTATVTFTNTFPALEVNSVTPSVSCTTGDSPTGSVVVNVSNVGCGTATDAVVRLTSSCGLTFTDQTVTLTASSSENVTFTFNDPCSTCNCTFTAEIDPENAICECRNANHSMTSDPLAVDVPDLQVQTASLAVTCNADGFVDVDGTVTLQNDGCNNTLTDDVPMRFTMYAGTGCTGTQIEQWTETLTGVSITTGNTQVLTIPTETITANLPDLVPGCEVSIQVEADYDDDICECDGTNNTYCADNIDVDIPDLAVQNQNLIITPTDDGEIQVSGSVTVVNSGCGNAVITDLPVRFTLYGNTGCTGSILGTSWTQTFTSVNITSNNGTQTFTLNPETITTDLPVNSNGCAVSIFVELDWDTDICEGSGTNNNQCVDNITFNVPDLEVQAETMAVNCASGGDIEVSGEITVVNNGCGTDMNTPVDVRFTLYEDTGCTGTSVSQWTETFSTANIVSEGGTQNFTVTPVTITADACAGGSADCEMSLLVEIDYNNTIFEGNGTDNSSCSTITKSTPELTVTAVAGSIVCMGDGNLTGTTVTVSNTGCAAAAGVVVRLTSDCGLTFDDQTVDLAAGETQSVLFLFTSGLTDCSCSFTATIDPDNAVCECDETNNTMPGTLSMSMPDIEIQAEGLMINCLEAGAIQVAGTVTLLNDGCGGNLNDNVPMQFTLYSGTGNTGTVLATWTETFTNCNISANGTQTFSIQPYDIVADTCSATSGCQLSILIEADYTDAVCEWDGANNTYTADKTTDCRDIMAADVTASTSCTADGELNGTISVTVTNNGLTAITDDFLISVDDGQGWSSELYYNADLNGTLPLATGATSTVTFTWSRDFTATPMTCEYPVITAQIDAGSSICQCSTENDTITTSYTLPYPNLIPTIVTASCAEDGLYSIEITVENNGCSSASNFILHVEDNSGNTRNVTVDGLGSGETTTVTITDWPGTCNMDTVVFTVVADSGNEVCEVDATDNTITYNYSETHPDLTITEVEPNVTTSTTGNVNGTITCTMTNNGNGPVTDDFKIEIDDGRGWTTTGYYMADFNGTLPIPVGETVTVTVNWNRSFSGPPFICVFNNIMVGIDSESTICECMADNNETETTYSIGYPDLYIDELHPDCNIDGERKLEVTIGNEGCGEQREDFEVTFTDSNGNTVTKTFTSIGGILPLEPGDEQTLTIDEWKFDCTIDMIEYTGTLVIDERVGDLIITNNTTSTSYNSNEPDLTIGSIDWTCNADGTVTFTIDMTNQGPGSASNASLIIYDNNGTALFNTTIDLASGVTEPVSFTTGNLPAGESLTFRFVTDENQDICECNGANNETTLTINCDETGEPGVTVTPNCPPGQQQGGLFTFEIEVENSGNSNLYNVSVHNILPEGFQYVPGTSTLSNTNIDDPLGTPMVWEIGSLSQGQSVTLMYSAVADADADPGRYCTQARVRGFTGADNTGAEIMSAEMECCTVVTRQSGAGCCLRVEEWPTSPFNRPEGPLSFIEPYFHTESTMFATYASFRLWNQQQPEEGSMANFIKQRMTNYARSNIEEFYLGSKLGLTLPDGSLWLSFAGAYPEQDEQQTRWVRKNVDETMTVSQIAFELLALNEAIKIEKRENINAKLKLILEKKLEFIAKTIGKLPHGWELADKKKKKEDHKYTESDIRRTDEDATLYDRVVLYFSMLELKESGYAATGDMIETVRATLENIDDKGFDRTNLREELMFTLALMKEGKAQQAKAKIKAFEAALKNIEEESDNAKGKDNEKKKLGLHDYALATYVDKVAGGTMYEELMKRMKDKFYLQDTGIFADKQPDFTFKMNLKSLASLVMFFDTAKAEELNSYATVLYRTFDEVGLFLKKRNLMDGKPIYSLLKNYPFSEPLLPVLSFTKAKKAIAPVFSQDAIVHSTRVKPLGEVLVPRDFSKILSPSYETDSARIASLAFDLLYMGKTLEAKKERVIKEEGRSFTDAGKKYMDSLLKSGAGLQMKGLTLIPFDSIAIKGPKKGRHNMEPLNSGTLFSTETLANYMTAELLYVEGKGKNAAAVEKLLAFQQRIIAKFKKTGYVPKAFNIYINQATDEITLIPSEEKAVKLTLSRLYHALPKEKSFKFILKALKKAEGVLLPEDFMFLSAVPELVPYFEKDIQTVIDHKDSKISYNSADIIGRGLLGKTNGVEDKLDNLLKNWDKEALLPKSDEIKNIEKGLIYHHNPRQLLLYLLATKDSGHFRFKRTLNFFTYLLENEWGVEWDESFIKFPSSQYHVFREGPRDTIEPGDLVNIKVRVDNTCPEGFGSSKDLGSLYLKASFSPPLVYTGTQLVDGLSVVNDFQWRYNGFPEGSVLEYTYQAFVPYEYKFNFLDGTIYAGGGQGLDVYGPGTGAGSECEDTAHLRRLNFIPLEEVHGIVFEDRNVNGVKDVGEPGIPNILLKDTRGRMFRSNGEGRFTILVGENYEGVQIELKSVPSDFMLKELPTRLVNRNYIGEIAFPMIPCKTVLGFAYADTNGNGTFDVGEERQAGVLLQAEEKEVVTDNDGVFIFRNLPVLWEEFIKLADRQPYFKGDTSTLKFDTMKR